MSDREHNAAPTPLALVTLGNLRETVSAANNLLGLLQSPRVGPQVLRPLLPELERILSLFQDRVVPLTQFLERELALDPGTLRNVENCAVKAPSELVAELQRAAHGPFGAKARLGVERKLQSLLPLLTTTSAHLELLVEASYAPSVPVSVRELFSIPRDDSNKGPYRSISIVGTIDAVEVDAPASVITRCLGCLASTLKLRSNETLALHLSVENERVSFRLCSGEGVAPTHRFPTFLPSANSKEVIRAALQPYNGHLGEDGRTLALPGRHHAAF